MGGLVNHISTYRRVQEQNKYRKALPLDVHPHPQVL